MGTALSRPSVDFGSSLSRLSIVLESSLGRRRVDLASTLSDPWVDFGLGRPWPDFWLISGQLWSESERVVTDWMDLKAKLQRGVHYEFWCGKSSKASNENVLYVMWCGDYFPLLWGVATSPVMGCGEYFLVAGCGDCHLSRSVASASLCSGVSQVRLSCHEV